MNRAELVLAAQREHIRPDAYSLEGGLPPERLVLAIETDGWTVYYSERGLRSGEVHFETEGEACSHMFERLLRDPTTRE